MITGPFYTYRQLRFTSVIICLGGNIWQHLPACLLGTSVTLLSRLVDCMALVVCFRACCICAVHGVR